MKKLFSPFEKKTYKAIRAVFNNTIIVCNGLTQHTAEQKL